MSLLSRAVCRQLASKLKVQPSSVSAARSTVANNTSRSITTYSQLPEEHQMIYDMCRRFAEEEIAPNASKWDKNHEFPDKVKDMVSLFCCRCLYLLLEELAFIVWVHQESSEWGLWFVFLVCFAIIDHILQVRCSWHPFFLAYFISSWTSHRIANTLVSFLVVHLAIAVHPRPTWV